MPDSSAQLDVSESRPVKGLRSLANPNSSSISHFVPHTHTASSAFLQKPSVYSNAISPLQCPSNSPAGRSTPQSGFCDIPTKDIPAQDEFDDWDIDLEELDECVPQRASAPEPDSYSTAKRMRPSAVSDGAPVVSSLRGFCNSTPKSAPLPSYVRSSSSTTSTPQNSLQLSVPSSGCRFTSPVTSGNPSGSSQWQRGPVTSRAEHCSLFQAVSSAPSTPQTPRPLHMPVLTNHLVQLVSAASKTPQRPRTDSVRPKTRRFPGPAGALPQQVTEEAGSCYRCIGVL